MNGPVLTYTFRPDEPHGFADLDGVRLTQAVVTDDGESVAEGTEGTVIAVWAEGAAYEVEFAAGLATVEAAHLVAARRSMTMPRLRASQEQADGG